MVCRLTLDHSRPDARRGEAAFLAQPRQVVFDLASRFCHDSHTSTRHGRACVDHSVARKGQAAQKWSFTTNSKSRGLPADVIVPNAEAVGVKDPFGSLNGGVLVTLNASARTSGLSRSLTRNVFPIIRSAFCSPGPRTGLREHVPKVNGAAVVNAATLKNSSTLRLAKSFGFAKPIGPLHGIAQTRIRIGRLRHHHAIAGLDPHVSGEMPTRNLPHTWNLINPSRREDAWDVARRKIPLQPKVIGILDRW